MADKKDKSNKDKSIPGKTTESTGSLGWISDKGRSTVSGSTEGTPKEVSNTFAPPDNPFGKKPDKGGQKKG